MDDHDRSQRNEADMVEVGDLGRAILAMRAFRPPADVTARVEAKLAPLFGPSGPEGSSSPQTGEPANPGPGDALSSVGSVGAVKGLLLAAAVAMVSLGALEVWNRGNHPSAAPATAVVEEAQAPEEPVQPTIDADTTIHPVASVEAPAPAVAPTPRPVRPAALPTEAHLLASARRLLASDPAASIGFLRQHAALYPNGMLSQERDVLLIDAKARMGRVEEARKSAEDFLRDNPDSAHGTKVRESVFGDASTDRSSRP